MADRFLMLSLFLTLSHHACGFTVILLPIAPHTKVDDDDGNGEEDSLMCRSTFEMHFILGFQLLCYWEHSFVLTVSFQMIVISIGKCQHIAERFVVLRA